MKRRKMWVKGRAVRRAKGWAIGWGVAVMLGLSACNSISFFPQAAAEKAADRVIDDIHPDNAKGETAKALEANKP